MNMLNLYSSSAPRAVMPTLLTSLRSWSFFLRRLGFFSSCGWEAGGGGTGVQVWVSQLAAWRQLVHRHQPTRRLAAAPANQAFVPGAKQWVQAGEILHGVQLACWWLSMLAEYFMW